MGAGASAEGRTPDCYYCHLCKQSFEFSPGMQPDGRPSDAPDICTSCGADAIEMVREGTDNGSMMPATDTLHQLVLASGGAVSGHELLMNMLAFGDHGLGFLGFGRDPADGVMQSR